MDIDGPGKRKVHKYKCGSVLRLSVVRDSILRVCPSYLCVLRLPIVRASVLRHPADYLAGVLYSSTKPRLAGQALASAIKNMAEKLITLSQGDTDAWLRSRLPLVRQPTLHNGISSYKRNTYWPGDAVCVVGEPARIQE